VAVVGLEQNPLEPRANGVVKLGTLSLITQLVCPLGEPAPTTLVTMVKKFIKNTNCFVFQLLDIINIPM
jgi:hypothetical protein